MVSKRLGKGLSALIGGFETDISPSGREKKKQLEDSLIYLDVKKIDPNPDQPRQVFDAAKIEELAHSLKSVGIIEPVVAFRKKDRYCLIAGERRLRAARKAGFKTIPAIVKEDAGKDMFEMMLIENIQREDLSPVEEAMSYRQILQNKQITHERLAGILGKSRTYVTNLLRILNLPHSILEKINQRQISVGQAKILVGLSPEKQREAFAAIFKESLSVRQVEKIAGKLRESSKSRNLKKANLHLSPFEDKLRTTLKTRVAIRDIQNKVGKIEIEYYNYEQLENFVTKLTKR